MNPPTPEKFAQDVAWGSARTPYAKLQDFIYGHGYWALNPWVWAIKFKRTKP
jgi:hypothetical protein